MAPSPTKKQILCTHKRKSYVYVHIYDIIYKRHMHKLQLVAHLFRV